MISYFKYDKGNAFTLNDQPYIGFLHVIDGKAYSGKISDLESQELSSRSNFLSEFYLNQMEFDFTFDNIELAAPYVLNSFDILNKTNLEQIFDRINTNNLLVFKSLVLQNPNLFDTNRTNTHFYGLSSTDADIRNDDVPSGKTTYTHIDPFSFDSEWGFLDSIVTGDFIVDYNDNFLYFCSDGTTQYTISGSFINYEPIALLNAAPSEIFYIKQDTVDSKIFTVSLSTINIYDLQNFISCQTFSLLDSISVSIMEEYKHLVKIGKNIRTQFDGSNLYFYNKYSTELYSSIPKTQLQIDELISLDIREVDDLTIFLGKVGDTYYFGEFDSEDVSNTLKLTEVFHVTEESELIFSATDSNVFYVSNNAIIQGRLISNPSYFFGQTNESTYFYLNDYLYNTTREKWNEIQIKYNSNSLPSNSFNNLLFRFFPRDTTQYLLTHNVGRIYVSKLELVNSYLNAVPLDIDKSYDGTDCSESSFGLFFNTTIANLIKDTLRLYGLAAESYTLREGEVTKNVISELTFDFDNLYLNGNEPINIISIQRILSLINFIQNQLISLS